MKHTTHLLALILTAGLLSLAAPAQAIYIETPLNLVPGQDQADVGDDIELKIQPNQNNETAKQDWADKTVKLYYSYDPNESSDPDRSVSNHDRVETLLDTITLDSDATGVYTWTIPAEVDDRNVDLQVKDDAGDSIAFGLIAIGDAEPMMYLAAASGPNDGVPEFDPEQATGDETGEAASLGLVSLIGALGAAALGLARVRRS